MRVVVPALFPITTICRGETTMTSAVSGRAMDTRRMSKALSRRTDWLAYRESVFPGAFAASGFARARAGTPARSPRQSTLTAMKSPLVLVATPLTPSRKFISGDLLEILFRPLVPLDHLDGVRLPRRRGRSSFLLRDPSGLLLVSRCGRKSDGRLPIRGEQTSLVDPPGHHVVRVRVVPQDQLDLPVVAGEGELLRVIGSHGESDGIHGDRLVILLLLHHLSGGEHPDVLQYFFRHQAVLPCGGDRRRHDHVAPGVRAEEPPHPDALVHLYGERPHPLRDPEGEEACRLVHRDELALDHRLPPDEVPQGRPPHHGLRIPDGVLGVVLLRPGGNRHLVRVDRGTLRDVDHCDHDSDGLEPGLLGDTASIGEELVCPRAGDQGQKGSDTDNHQDFFPVHQKALPSLIFPAHRCRARERNRRTVQSRDETDDQNREIVGHRRGDNSERGSTVVHIDGRRRDPRRGEDLVRAGGRLADGSGRHDRHSHRLARGAGQDVSRHPGPPELRDAENEGEEHRNDKGEFDEVLPFLVFQDGFHLVLTLQTDAWRASPDPFPTSWTPGGPARRISLMPMTNHSIVTPPETATRWRCKCSAIRSRTRSDPQWRPKPQAGGSGRIPQGTAPPPHEASSGPPS